MEYVMVWPKGYVVLAETKTVLLPSEPKLVAAVPGMRKTCARPPSAVVVKELARNLGYACGWFTVQQGCVV